MNRAINLLKNICLKKLFIILGLILCVMLFLGDTTVPDNNENNIKYSAKVMDSIVVSSSLVAYENQSRIVSSSLMLSENNNEDQYKNEDVAEDNDDTTNQTEIEDENIKEEIQDIKDGMTYEEIFYSLFPDEDYNKTIIYLAKTVHGEACGVDSITNRACVIWCILNRVDQNHRGDNPRECATAHGQFAYRKRNKPTDEEIYIATDVLNHWLLEKVGGSVEEVGRVLPKEIVYFSGNGTINVFRWGYPIGTRKYTNTVHSDVYGD